MELSIEAKRHHSGPKIAKDRWNPDVRRITATRDSCGSRGIVDFWDRLPGARAMGWSGLVSSFREFNEGKPHEMVVVVDGGEPIVSEAYEPVELDAAALAPYVG